MTDSNSARRFHSSFLEQEEMETFNKLRFTGIESHTFVLGAILFSMGVLGSFDIL